MDTEDKEKLLLTDVRILEILDNQKKNFSPLDTVRREQRLLSGEE